MIDYVRIVAVHMPWSYWSVESVRGSLELQEVGCIDSLRILSVLVLGSRT